MKKLIFLLVLFSACHNEPRQMTDYEFKQDLDSILAIRDMNVAQLVLETQAKAIDWAVNSCPVDTSWHRPDYSNMIPLPRSVNEAQMRRLGDSAMKYWHLVTDAEMRCHHDSVAFYVRIAHTWDQAGEVMEDAEWRFNNKMKP